MAKTYIAKSKDNEISDRNSIQVEESEAIESKRILTLSYINTQISVKNGQIQNLQSEIAELQETKTAIETEANKVALKVDK